jgi:hypothetical protein
MTQADIRPYSHETRQINCQPRANRCLLRFGLDAVLFVIGGAVLGAISTSLAWEMKTPMALEHREETIFMEAFEERPSIAPLGFPRESGIWSGDYSEVVDTFQGVEPYRGSHMLRFLRADYEGKKNSHGSYIGDLYRLIDVSAMFEDPSDESRGLRVSAHFYAARNSSQEAYRCSISVFALSRLPAPDASISNEADLHQVALASSQRLHHWDAQRYSTWQKLSTEMRLHPQTRYLLLRFSIADQSHCPNQAARHFDSHFLDEITVTITP